MRKKMVTLVAAGVLGVGAAAVAGPALAAATSPTTTSSGTSRVDRLKAVLSGLVNDKTLSQSQADKVATTLGARNIGPGAGPGPGGRHGHRGGQGAGMAAVAKALKMTHAELRTALQSGKSLAQIAKSQSVSVDSVVTALVAEAKTHLAKEVTDGRMTQAQADERLKDLSARITERVNSVRPARPARSSSAVDSAATN